MNKLLIFLALLSLGSCSIAPNRMFKTPKDYQYAKDTSSAHKGPYIIQTDDKIELHIFSNGGFKLIDVTASNLSESASEEGVVYIVEENGEAKMPVIGRIMLKGLSIKEAENLLQEKYSKYYMDPFVVIRVVSRRAYVFFSDLGRGAVVQIQNDHTSLYEALAMAGGLSEYSKAFMIKIVRGDPKNPQVFFANLSSLEGVRNSELEVYPNDIIYIDSAANFRKRLTTDFLPYLSIITSILVLIALLQN